MLISLLILVIVCGLLWYLVSMLPLAAPFKTIAQVVVILIAIIWVLRVAGMLPAGLL